MLKRLYLVLMLSLGLACGVTQAYVQVPAQYIAKGYSEALGRAPDTGGWSSAVTYFAQNGCSVSTLKTWGTSLLTSQEFVGLGYDPYAETLILYRFILDREPDSAGFDYWSNQLATGAMTWAQLVATSYGSAEFADLASEYICNVADYSFSPLGPTTAMQIPTPNPGGTLLAGTTQAQLQAQLIATGNGGTVYLQQESVVYITSPPLTIPTGVTLATYGNPPPHQHALMARLVRGNFGTPGAPLVKIGSETTSSTAAVRNLWIDGQRSLATPYVHDSVNIEISGGSNVVVDSNFIDNSQGWSNIHSYGTLDGAPCAGNTVTNNVVTAYSAVHQGGAATDGLSLGCDNTTVTGNGIIDPSDVGIVLFTAGTGTQRSVAESNTVVSAGHSAYGAFGFDPLYTVLGGGANSVNTSPTPSFAGAEINGNTFWSGPNTHFTVGLAIGSRPWFATTSTQVGNIGSGAQMLNNTTGGIRTNVAEGMETCGMLNATVEGNSLLANPIASSCTSMPQGNIFACVSAGLASGTLQGPYTDIDLTGLISDSCQ